MHKFASLFPDDPKDPSVLIAQAYIYLKEYDGIGEFISAPLGVGLSGKVRNLLRLWGNNSWP